jgi:U3 small nucleolar RNA-associated protein 10
MISQVENDMRGWQFVELTRSIYVNANSVSSLHAGSINLLRALFVNLGDDSLLFLAGIWSHTSYPDDIRAAALLHGNAFLAAQMSDNDRQRDFQVILPSLLIAFHSDNRRIRERAGICVRMLAGSNSAQRSNIYGFESIYGDNAGKCFLILQLLLFANPRFSPSSIP